MIRDMAKNVHKRINVTLPEATVTLLESVADKGSRSGFVNEAIRSYAKALGKKRLRDQLKEGALARADRDRAIAADWFEIEEELWRD